MRDQGMLGTIEHEELIKSFEQEYKQYRLDKEIREWWSKGRIYQDGLVNDLFLAYRKGCSYGRLVERQG